MRHDVRVPPGDPVLRISQALGPSARGCRLDAAALEVAVGLVSTRLAEGADLLILNKFGKHEAKKPDHIRQSGPIGALDPD